MTQTDQPRGRTISRFAAVQALFQSEQAQENLDVVIDQFVRHRFKDGPDSPGYEDGGLPNVRVALFETVVRATIAHQPMIDAMLSRLLPDKWPLSRIDPVLRAILRAGAAELTVIEGTPPNVVINEYIDIAKGFFNDDEPGVTNAVLDRLARLVRPNK